MLILQMIARYDHYKLRDAKRLEYLAEIARLRNISLRMLMNQLARGAVRFPGCEFCSIGRFQYNGTRSLVTEKHVVEVNTATTRVFDGHKLSEFIYGTVTGMVAVAGISGENGTSWLGAATIIVSGAAAIWIAHAYSMLISKRVTVGHRLEARDLGEALRGSWPIVTAGAILTAPILPASLNVWSLDFALSMSSLLGVIILALVGYLAGVVSRETWSRRLLLATLSAGLGVAVIAVEFAIHH